ncbi:hypothetical protein BDN72DRAFT_865653 [Pluteus cervinus]|uniref:Uncharacterized protein n=1 Tax=Pluteus cervinus TaxID=181527 RepID=A0ACD3A0F5_9AGAR|nr:hypothetical protein BDN72DRAFT_865653 [Pluteus cervinus]
MVYFRNHDDEDLEIRRVLYENVLELGMTLRELSQRLTQLRKDTPAPEAFSEAQHRLNALQSRTRTPSFTQQFVFIAITVFVEVICHTDFKLNKFSAVFVNGTPERPVVCIPLLSVILQMFEGGKELGPCLYGPTKICFEMFTSFTTEYIIERVKEVFAGLLNLAIICKSSSDAEQEILEGLRLSLMIEKQRPVSEKASQIIGLTSYLWKHPERWHLEQPPDFPARTSDQQKEPNVYVRYQNGVHISISDGNFEEHHLQNTPPPGTGAGTLPTWVTLTEEIPQDYEGEEEEEEDELME